MNDTELHPIDSIEFLVGGATASNYGFLAQTLENNTISSLMGTLQLTFHIIVLCEQRAHEKYDLLFIQNQF